MQTIYSYISDPRITLPIVLEELHRYGKISAFKINTAKSEILNITTSKREQQAIQPKFPFVWCREKLGYLVVNSIPSDL